MALFLVECRPRRNICGSSDTLIFMTGLYIYIYIYMDGGRGSERERERERDRHAEREGEKTTESHRGRVRGRGSETTPEIGRPLMLVCSALARGFASNRPLSTFHKQKYKPEINRARETRRVYICSQYTSTPGRVVVYR